MKNDAAVSELRNLGLETERELNRVGIYTRQDLVEAGVEEAFQLILAARRSRGEKMNAHATLLYALYGALHDLDWREIPQAKKDKFKKLAADLRNDL